MDERDGEQHVPSSTDVLGSIRRHWLVAASIVVICAVAGAVLAATQPRHYTATTTVLVGPPVDMLPTAINMATEKEVARSPAVAQRAIELLGLEATAAEVLPRISLDVPVDSNILRISASADAPEDARRLANAMGQAYLEFRRGSSLNGIEASTAVIDERIAALTRRLNKLRSEDAADPAERARDRTEASVIHSEISILEQRIATSATTGIVPGRIIAEATQPLEPSGPPVLASALLGALVGLLVAMGAVIAIESFDRRVHTTEEVQRAMRARILGEVGVPKGLETSSNGDGLLVDGQGRAALAFRRLRTNLLVALEARNGSGRSHRRRSRTVAVVAARDDVATSYVAANLGAVLATDGRRVTVVSVPQSSPSRLAAMLHADGEDLPPERTPSVRGTCVPNLQLAEEAVDTKRLGFLDMQDAIRIVDVAASDSSVVFVAAPPLETGEDGGTLVAASDDAIFVTWDDVNRDELERRREEMERLGTPLLGVVVLHRDPPAVGHWEARSAEETDEEEAAVWTPVDG